MKKITVVGSALKVSLVPLAYFEIKDGNTGTILNSLRFASNPWDSDFVTLGSDGSSGFSYKNRFSPINMSGIKNGTGIVINFDGGTFIFYGPNCISSDCFVRINNSIVTLHNDPGLATGYANYINGNEERGVLISGTDIRDPTKYNPLVRTAINEMYTAYSMKAGVTWSTNVSWRSVLLP